MRGATLSEIDGMAKKLCVNDSNIQAMFDIDGAKMLNQGLDFDYEYKHGLYKHRLLYASKDGEHYLLSTAVVKDGIARYLHNFWENEMNLTDYCIRGEK